MGWEDGPILGLRLEELGRYSWGQGISERELSLHLFCTYFLPKTVLSTLHASSLTISTRPQGRRNNYLCLNVNLNILYTALTGCRVLLSLHGFNLLVITNVWRDYHCYYATVMIPIFQMEKTRKREIWNLLSFSQPVKRTGLRLKPSTVLLEPSSSWTNF